MGLWVCPPGVLGRVVLPYDRPVRPSRTTIIKMMIFDCFLQCFLQNKPLPKASVGRVGSTGWKYYCRRRPKLLSSLLSSGREIIVVIIVVEARNYCRHYCRRDLKLLSSLLSSRLEIIVVHYCRRGSKLLSSLLSSRLEIIVVIIVVGARNYCRHYCRRGLKLLSSLLSSMFEIIVVEASSLSSQSRFQNASA